MSQSLSIVVVGRNDNYGGNFTKNIRQFVHNLSTLLPEAELVLIDWNPPEDRPPLSMMFAWPKGLKGQVITVPREVHQDIDNPNKLPLLEYYAKNIGIRRANGDFVLCTNPDTLFSEELASELKQELNHFVYYRANRVDIKPVPYPIYDIQNMQEFASENIIIKHGKWGSYKGVDPTHHSLAFLRRIKRYYTYRTFSVPHENAAGDFLLASKETWWEIDGYPEFSSRSHIDSIAMCLIHQNNKKLEPLIRGKSNHTFKGPLYHQDHDRKLLLRDRAIDITKANIMRGYSDLPRRMHDWGMNRQQFPTEVMS